MAYRNFKRRYYPCRHVDHRHTDRYMAELCRDLDDKILESGKDEQTINRTKVAVSKKSQSNK
jgi:hypothetical protein